MTSHKPATPRLPLRVARRGGKTIEIANAHGGTIAILDERLADRGEYLVHAANAYPKLVERIEAAMSRMNWALEQGHVTAESDEMMAEVKQARSLLRSLGEL